MVTKKNEEIEKIYGIIKEHEVVISEMQKKLQEQDIIIVQCSEVMQKLFHKIYTLEKIISKWPFIEVEKKTENRKW